MLPPMFICYGYINESNQVQSVLISDAPSKLDLHNGGSSSSIICNTKSMKGVLCSDAAQKIILTHAFNHIQLPHKRCLAGPVGQRWIIHWCKNSMGNKFRFCVSRNASCEMEIEKQKKIMGKHTHIDRQCQSVTIDIERRFGGKHVVGNVMDGPCLYEYWYVT